MEESLLLVQEEEHMATEDLILLTPAGIEISDEQGNPAQPSQLEAGTTVRIEYDGSVLETYPCQLGGVTALQMTGTFESLLPFTWTGSTSCTRRTRVLTTEQKRSCWI